MTYRFHVLLSLLCLAYLVLQIIYVNRLPLVMDEYAGMATILQHRNGIPYLDFMPYKTVLGYYIELLPTFITDETWPRLIVSKLYLAAINTIAIFWVARRLAKQFRPTAVLLATLLLICMSTFLERSSDLRVDMLTSICGLIGFIWLIERRLILSGLATGIGLLVSQKAAYFALAGGGVLLIEIIASTDRRESLRDLFRFGAAALAPLVVYLSVFGILAGPGTVLRKVFLAPQAIAFDEIYDIRRYWSQTIVRNPLFWGLSILSIGLLLLRASSRTHRIIAVYGALMFALCLWHKQPWPYFFVILIPTCYVLIAAVLDNYLWQLGRKSLFAVMVILASTGVALPLTRVPVNLARDNGFQHYMVDTSEQLLAEYTDEAAYLAGVNLLPTRRHVPSTMIWLDRPRLAALRRRGNYDDLITEMDSQRLLLIISNYRLYNLPTALDSYIKAHYLRLFGNIMLYAPSIAQGNSNTFIAFSGRYRVIEGTDSILIDNRSVPVGSTVELESGLHEFVSTHPLRLKLLPTGIKPPANPDYLAAQKLFPSMYDY